MISNYILACVNFWKMAVYICTYCPDDRTDVIIRLGCHLRVVTCTGQKQTCTHAPVFVYKV